MRIEVDFSRLVDLAVDLRTGSAGLEGDAGRAVGDAANTVKAAMRADMAASAHFGQAAASITFDRRGTTAEVGPTKRGGGAIANIAYFGGANGGGGTVRDPLEPAVESLPEFEKAIGDLVEGILG